VESHRSQSTLRWKPRASDFNWWTFLRVSGTQLWFSSNCGLLLFGHPLPPYLRLFISHGLSAQPDKCQATCAIWQANLDLAHLEEERELCWSAWLLVMGFLECGKP
jgi:hypothetical protein